MKECLKTFSLISAPFHGNSLVGRFSRKPRKAIFSLFALFMTFPLWFFFRFRKVCFHNSLLAKTQTFRLPCELWLRLDGKDDKSIFGITVSVARVQQQQLEDDFFLSPLSETINRDDSQWSQGFHCTLFAL